MNPENSPYIAWLQEQGVPLFKNKDTYWQIYREALIPASIAPCFITIASEEGKGLLKASGAWLLRYSSDPCEKETEWWYVVCDEYDQRKLSSNTRSKINRGSRNCSVRQVRPEWLAKHGYTCYVAAHKRYTNAFPVTDEAFRTDVLAAIGGPFECWAIFVGESLAGYCRCIVDHKHVSTSSVKFDPAYLKYYSAYAMVSFLIDHYVVKQGMVISNGNRSVSHDTNFQEFLLRLGFRRWFCRLHVIYQPWLRSVVQIVAPFGQLITRLPNRGSSYRLRALLFQEELRRLCQ